jgi:hypothetical protein
VCLKSRGFNGHLGICLSTDAMMHTMHTWVVDIAADKSHSSCSSEVCAWLGVVYTEVLNESHFPDDDATITSTLKSTILAFVDHSWSHTTFPFARTIRQCYLAMCPVWVQDWPCIRCRLCDKLLPRHQHCLFDHDRSNGYAAVGSSPVLD